MRPLLIGAGVLLGGAGAFVFLRRRFVVVTVSGPSMEPTLAHGDRLLVRRRPARPPRLGDIVVLQPPPDDLDWDALPRRTGTRGPWNIKRVAAGPGDPVPGSAAKACGLDAGAPVPAGRYVVIGDGAVSYDSREWGLLPADRILGVLRRRLAAR
ncbi:S26 family signal peptidase [Dactylosporangium sp. CA-052675]|uniref:S26 family signal peptidase n=1 Tax=Dactylosporangium sp. CA-052675 TaxID=3239927 RepID=UPI003D8F5F6D